MSFSIHPPPKYKRLPCVYLRHFRIPLREDAGEKPPALAAQGAFAGWLGLAGLPAGRARRRGRKGMAAGAAVCGTSPSGWASAGNIKTAPSPKNSAPLKSMRTHGPSFPQPCYPPLQKRGGMGIISLWRSSNCCAEWYGHSYRAVGCCLHPAACRIHVSSSYCNPDFPKLQGVSAKSPKSPARPEGQAGLLFRRFRFHPRREYSRARPPSEVSR